MAEITIKIGLGKDEQSDSMMADRGGNASNPSACVILVPEDFEEPIFDKIKCIYVSNDENSVKTAEKYSKELNSPVEYKTKNLLYWDIGDLRNESSDTLKSRLPFYIDWAPETKVDNKESFNEFKKRFLSELEGIMEEAKKENASILVVSHNVCCKLAYAWLEETEEHPESGKNDEFYTVDSADFIGTGFKDPFPIRIEWDGSEWECEEFSEDSDGSEEEENGKDD